MNQDQEMTHEKKIKALEERARRLKVDFIDLSRYEMNRELADLVSITFARQYKLIPVTIKEGHLLVAMEDPTDLYIREQLTIRTKQKIRPVLADTEDILSALKRIYAEISPEDIGIPALEEGDFQQVSHLINENTINWFRTLLVNAIKRDASDVHVEVYETEIRVRFRIDGIVAETISLPRQMENQVNVFIKSLTGMKLEKRNVPQEGFFEISVRDRKLMVRVASLPTRIGERFIFKITDERKMIRSLDELGFHMQDLERLHDLLRHRQGLVIVSGPAGTGISTTLYSILLKVAKPEYVAFSIEDPIEAPLPGINQLEVNTRIEMGYKECLRMCLRHDPDIIMLSRTRESEVAHLIVEAALTGQLALAGLHARDAVDAICRLRDFGLELYFVATPLLGVLSQRLARTVCPHCSHPVEASGVLLSEFERHGIAGPYSLRAGEGCNHCLHTGFKGRIGIYEVLPVSESLKSMILRGCTKHRISEQAVRDGMRTLLHDGLDKVARGLTTYDEIQRVLID